MARSRPVGCARRGGSANTLLVTLCAVGALGAAAVVLEPRFLLGDARGGPASVLVPASHGVHQEQVAKLATLIQNSVGVLGLHHRGSAPYEEVVLWLHDEEKGSPGRPVEREVALLSHSLVMRTITLYRIAGPGDATARELAPLGSLAFCEMLRADRRVGSLVLATGVSNMRVETTGQTRELKARGGRGDRQRLRLTLTWPPDSADGQDEASVLVDTVLFASGAPE